MDPINTISVPPHVVSREVDGVTTLLNLVDGTCFTLDDTGARIWQLLEEGRSVQMVCVQLASEYDAPPDEIKADIVAFVTELQDKSFVDAV